MSTAATVSTISDDVPIVTASTAAAQLGVCYRTVIALAEKGVLPYIRDTTQRRMFTARDIQRVLKARTAATKG